MFKEPSAKTQPDYLETTDESEEISLDKRVRKIPDKLRDYELYLAYCSQNFVKNVPCNFDEAMKSDQKNLWKQAVDSEIQSTDDNEIWTIVEKPND